MENATKEQTGLIPFDQLKQMATALGKNKLFGKTPEELLPLMLIAQAEGKHPAIAAQEYDIIQGKPAINSRAALARFQSAGGKIQWLKREDTEASATFEHPAGGSVTITWNIERAKKAGLTGKKNWETYPAQMLAARVMAEGVRACFPACLSGLYTSEEVQDFPHMDRTPDSPGTSGEYDDPPEPTKQERDVTNTTKLPKTTYTLVGEYVTRAVTMHYISPAMADLYRKEREEHKSDEAHLAGMLTRIKAQADAAKADLDKAAGKAFDKKPEPAEEDFF